jgi:hypothetical protein
VNQKELLELARQTMKKRGGGRKKAHQARPAPSQPPSRTENVDSALARIAALDQELEDISRVSSAQEGISEAENHATQGDSIQAARAMISELDEHIQEEHSFKTYQGAGILEEPNQASVATMRQAFKMSLIFGPPKGME